MARRETHWRDKLITQHKGATIVKHINVSSIINDVDYYSLFDKDGNSVARGIDYNELHRLLYAENRQTKK